MGRPSEQVLRPLVRIAGLEVVIADDSRSEYTTFVGYLGRSHFLVELNDLHEIRSYNRVAKFSSAPLLSFMQVRHSDFFEANRTESDPGNSNRNNQNCMINYFSDRMGDEPTPSFRHDRPIRFNMIVARTEGYMYAAQVRSMPLVQGPGHSLSPRSKPESFESQQTHLCTLVCFSPLRGKRRSEAALAISLFSLTLCLTLSLMQDDDAAPSSSLWSDNAVKLFRTLPKLMVLGGFRGRMDLGWLNDPRHNFVNGPKFGPTPTEPREAKKCCYPIAYTEPKSQVPFMYMYKVSHTRSLSS